MQASFAWSTSDDSSDLLFKCLAQSWHICFPSTSNHTMKLAHDSPSLPHKTSPDSRSFNGKQDHVGISSKTVENLYDDSVLDPAYYAKTLVLNNAIQEVGMGRYQV